MTDPDRKQLDFHEATIESVAHVGNIVNLKLCNVIDWDEQAKDAEVRIENIQQILREGQPVNNLETLGVDTEIVTLEKEGNEVILAVQNYNPANRKLETIVYDFKGRDVTLRLVRI